MKTKQEPIAETVPDKPILDKSPDRETQPQEPAPEQPLTIDEVENNDMQKEPDVTKVEANDVGPPDVNLSINLAA